MINVRILLLMVIMDLQSEEDQGKDGLRTLKRIYRGWE
jgi:hypothetical protein